MSRGKEKGVCEDCKGGGGGEDRIGEKVFISPQELQALSSKVTNSIGKTSTEGGGEKEKRVDSPIGDIRKSTGTPWACGIAKKNNSKNNMEEILKTKA